MKYFVIQNTQSGGYLSDTLQSVFHTNIELAERFDTHDAALVQVELTYLNSRGEIKLAIVPAAIIVRPYGWLSESITPPWVDKWAIRLNSPVGGNAYYRATFKHQSEVAVSNTVLGGVIFDTQENALSMAGYIRGIHALQNRSDIIVDVVSVEDEL